MKETHKVLTESKVGDFPGGPVVESTFPMQGT